jgi:hypothetical protein
MGRNVSIADLAVHLRPGMVQQMKQNQNFPSLPMLFVRDAQNWFWIVAGGMFACIFRRA